MIKPYKERPGGKKEQIGIMFDNIANNYDFLNHFLSLGTDKRWRKIAIKYLKTDQPKIILDVATGTADLAIMACKTLNPNKVIGIDISKKMLDIGKVKVAKLGYSNIIKLLYGDSENLPFNTNTFDAVTVAFGIRNFETLEKGLAEIYRVMKPGAKFIILEFSQPVIFPIKQLYKLYFTKILPLIGRAFSKDKFAYNYLPISVMTFPEGKSFLLILRKVGFTKCAYKRLSMGIVTLYLAHKY